MAGEVQHSRAKLDEDGNLYFDNGEVLRNGTEALDQEIAEARRRHDEAMARLSRERPNLAPKMDQAIERAVANLAAETAVEIFRQPSFTDPRGLAELIPND